MSEGDENQILDWFDNEYPPSDPEDRKDFQFEKDTLKSKKASKKALVPYDSDEENDPKNYPFNKLKAKGARGNTKKSVRKSSSKKPDNLPKFIDSDVAHPLQ